MIEGAIEMKLRPFVYKTVITLILSASIVLTLLPGNVQAASMKTEGALITQTSFEVKWSGSKEYDYWRIRYSEADKTGEYGSYKTVKILTRSIKSFLVKKLKKNTYYTFEITGGTKKGKKYKPLTYDYFWNVYTGISQAEWMDYAASDAPCSPSCIELWGYSEENGLPAKGFQIYRKEKGESSYTKIETIGKKGFPYKDTTVKKGKTYQYRIRSYGSLNGKTLYSPFSSVLTRSAVNQKGKFRSKKISASKGELVLKLESVSWNADLILKSDSLSVPAGEDDAIPVVIKEYSTDNKSWRVLSKRSKITLKDGTSIYLRLRPKTKTLSMKKVRSVIGENVTYDNLPCIFGLTVGGNGSAVHNDEYIH